MLIPSIDLRGGKVVQLVQGERLAIETDDLWGWVDRFAAFPLVQLIDLDAAIGTGSNVDLVRQVCARRRCRVGGGIRSIDRAQETLDAGAQDVIVGSALFGETGANLTFADALAHAVGIDRVIAAVDSRAGRVVVKGWRQSTPLTAVDAVRALDRSCAGFLYTHVDTEGLMRGIDMQAVREVRAVTARSLAAAGGITTRQEIDDLDRLSIDAVVGMAIYTGTLELGR